MPENDSITAVNGILAGHWTDKVAATGCTVVLCPEGATAAVDTRGGAPGTRETDALAPGNLVSVAHGVLLTGGSAFGLNAAAGVMRWLEERGHGFPVIDGVVPIVPAAVLFDLPTGRPDVRPDADAGYAACNSASSAPVEQGSVGAGTGATVAKALGPAAKLKGGIGSAAERTANGIAVGAIVALNCFGEVVDPDSGRTIAGPRGEAKGEFVSTRESLRAAPLAGPFTARAAGPNSTIAVVATDAKLTKEGAYRLAVMAQAGLTRTIVPVHTPVDGDTVFALATGRAGVEADVMQLGTLAALAMERAVIRAVETATGLAGVPSAREWAES